MSRQKIKTMIYQGAPVSEYIHETITLSGKINAVDPLSSEGLAELVALLESEHPGIKKLNRGSTLVVNGAEISLPNTLVRFTDEQIGWTALATHKSGETSVLANNDLVGEGNLTNLAQVKSVWHSGSAPGEIIVKTEHLGCYYLDDQSETQRRLSAGEELRHESSLNRQVYGLGETQILPGRSVYADPQTLRKYRPLKAYAAQPKLGNKELFSYLLDLNGTLPDDQKKPFCLELFRVLSELHDVHGIIHHDIKMENIRIDDTDPNNVRFYMIDFGSSLRLDDNKPDVSKLTGTLGYMAPEVFKHKPPTTKSDVFAAGVMAAMLVSPENTDCFMVCAGKIQESLTEVACVKLNDEQLRQCVEGLGTSLNQPSQYLRQPGHSTDQYDQDIRSRRIILYNYPRIPLQDTAKSIALIKFMHDWLGSKVGVSDNSDIVCNDLIQYSRLARDLAVKVEASLSNDNADNADRAKVASLSAGLGRIQSQLIAITARLGFYADALVANITEANFGEGHREMAELVQEMLAFESVARPNMANCYARMQAIIAPKQGNEGGGKESPDTVMACLDGLSPATEISSSERQQQSSTSSSSSSQSSLGKRSRDNLLDKDRGSLEDSFANKGASLEVQQKKQKYEPSAVSTSRDSLFPSSDSTQKPNQSQSMRALSCSGK